MLTDPVGAARQGGNGSTNAYRYVGEYGYYRDSAAVQYVRARWLAVGTGRWLSEDPLRFEADDFNLYRYVGNEPVAGSGVARTGNKKCLRVSKTCIEYLLVHFGNGDGGCLVKEFTHAASDIIGCSCKYGIDDLLVLAVAFCESNFGRAGRPPCDPRRVHNPFSCHFCPTAKGLNKLKRCNGCYPSLADSACCAAHTIRDHDGLGGGAWGAPTMKCVPLIVPKMLRMCRRAKIL